MFVWRSEDGLAGSVLLYHVDSELSHQPWRQTPLSAEPSSWTKSHSFPYAAGNVGKLLLL